MMQNRENTVNSFRTREQRMAETAFQCVEKRAAGTGNTEYLSFANSFPTLVHSCGLVQAVAFAEAKKNSAILEDIAEVLHKPLDEITKQARSKPLPAYMLLSREVLSAAGWLKRYSQALIKENKGEGNES